MLSAKSIAKYNQFRKNTDKSLICHAPFVNLNFDQNGYITACCYNKKDILGRYPNDTILDAWTGNAAQKLREYIKNNDLQNGCSLCRDLIEAENFSGTKARFYDEYASHSFLSDFFKKKFQNEKINLPRVVELELSNTCNLECVMCSGFFSSSIRKNREKLAPFPLVYDSKFVEQLSALMPTLTDMKFLGGEPFLIDIYYDIWEKIIEINPKIRVHITTNGTVLNERAKRILSQLNVGIIMSIDSINPETYSKIRKGANFSKMMENFQYFKKITKQKKTYLSIAACPMTLNWKEIPDLVYFANANSSSIHFNTVINPSGYSLYNMEVSKLQEVVEWYNSQISSRLNSSTTAMKNRNALVGLKDSLLARRKELESNIKIREWNRKIEEWLSKTNFSEPEFKDATFRMIMAGFICFEFPTYKTNKRIIESLPELVIAAQYEISRDWMLQIIKEKGSKSFSISFFKEILFINKILERIDILFTKKVELIERYIEEIPKIQLLANRLIENNLFVEYNKVSNLDIKQVQYDFESTYY